jgi:HSP20 family protein
MRENYMTVMTTSWDLFEDLRSAQDELLRTSTGRGARPWQQNGTTSNGTWAPPVDISERKDAYLVACELPGVSASEVEIIFEDGLLTIQGERHRATEANGDKVHRAERRYGTFRRSITLPINVQADKIEASAQDGVLMVLVPKAKEARAKRIEVRASVSQATHKPGTAAKNGS